MQRTAKLLSLSAFLTVQILGQSVFAVGPQCANVFRSGDEQVMHRGAIQFSTGASGTTADVLRLKAAKPLVDGGIYSEEPILNQECVGFCWAYGFAELAQDMSGGSTIFSPEHSGFWHFYFQIAQHPAYFTNLINRIQSSDPLKKMTLEQATDEAILMLSLRPHSRTAAAAKFVVDEGSDEPTALTEAKIVGIIPAQIYSRPIATPDQANQLSLGLKSLVKAILLTKNRSSFSQKDADGINTPLYQLMVQEIGPAFNAASKDNHAPYRPNEQFTLPDGSTHTPLSYMSDVAKFNPEDWVDVQMTLANIDLVQDAMRTSLTLKHPIPVPTGFAIFGDQQQFQTEGFLSRKFLAGALIGGHLTLSKNQLVDGNGVVADMEMNSWGPQGLTANGTVSSDSTQIGFDGLTVDYLKGTILKQEPPDALFHKSILQMPKYAPLLKDVSKN